MTARRSRLLAGSLLASLLLATGCATLPSHQLCPSQGGLAWREVQSPHFRVRTDLESAEAARVTKELEQQRTAVARSFGEAVDPPGQMEVVVLRNPQSLRAYGSTQVAGYVSTYGSESLMVMLQQGFEQDSLGRTSVAVHELAHHVSHFVLLRQPRWLAEGLAGYYETMKLEEGEALVGRPPDSWLSVVLMQGQLPLARLWEWDTLKEPTENQQVMLYASSWLWVHYLSNQHASRFTAFQERLARAEDPQRAWAATFAGTSPAAMEHELMEYCHRIFPVRTVALPPPATWQLRERPLSDAEVHVVRAGLWMSAPGPATPAQREAGVQTELAEALRLEPALLSARLLEVQLTDAGPERLARARALTQAQPESGRAWVLLAQALGAAGRGEEALGAVERASTLGGEDAFVLNHVAWTYLAQGRAAQAQPLSQRAMQLAPWVPEYLDTHAAALAQLGRCPEAAALEQRALDALSENAPELLRAHLRERHAHYAKGCGAPAESRP